MRRRLKQMSEICMRRVCYQGAYPIEFDFILGENVENTYQKKERERKNIYTGCLKINDP